MSTSSGQVVFLFRNHANPHEFHYRTRVGEGRRKAVYFSDWAAFVRPPVREPREDKDFISAVTWHRRHARTRSSVPLSSFCFPQRSLPARGAQLVFSACFHCRVRVRASSSPSPARRAGNLGINTDDRPQRQLDVQYLNVQPHPILPRHATPDRVPARHVVKTRESHSMHQHPHGSGYIQQPNHPALTTSALSHPSSVVPSPSFVISSLRLQVAFCYTQFKEQGFAALALLSRPGVHM
ncbi:hypothetical protein GALMADRAFT_259875 [Galerina marginata CBS 339.88]|uniref:Uncharacterized protein n=1 Tax=Galerina marginata (strain CBS 339.88) TaxID=685588 RepID=A0A067SH26_GALM3|nr:hypothetical protein GALMADRAFT_259875 [Galerina marginata CBS 339.88]